MAEKQWPQKHFLTFIHAVLFGNCCGPLIWKFSNVSLAVRTFERKQINFRSTLRSMSGRCKVQQFTGCPDQND